MKKIVSHAAHVRENAPTEQSSKVMFIASIRMHA